MRGRDKFKKFRVILKLLQAFYSVFPRKIRLFFFVRRRKTCGYYGLAVRYALLKTLAKSVGDNVSIYPDVYLFNVQNLIIGNNVSIHPMSYVEAYGGVVIGNDVSIAQGTTIMSVNHDFSKLDIPIKDQGIEARPILIENDVWIGAKATVLGNVTIASGTVVGASAVVTKNTECNSVVAGIPARIIKKRD